MTEKSWWEALLPSGLLPSGCWDLICCTNSVADEEESEEVVVYMNDPEANLPFHYPNNFICTSKYTLWSFLPLSLFYQFIKASNIYFLIAMIFSLIPGVAPVSPATAVAPLVVVIVVALIKEAVEDLKRHQADNRANSITAHVIRNEALVDVRSKDIQAGDVMKIYNGEEVRADVVFFASALEEGQAFIDTCNLDGETSLKSRKALEQTWAFSTVEAFRRSKGTLHTSPPDPGLLSWTGMIELDGSEYSLSLDQFLYRGCVLRNTDWVWGMVAYAGIDTKLFRNLKKKPAKSSNLDHKLNYFIIVIFVLQNILLFIVCSLAVWWNATRRKEVYLHYFLDAYRNGRLWGYRYLTYFILFSYCVPISLFITTELCKVIQAQWMRVDCDLMEFMGDRWRHCQPNTSNLNEQLAMVRFIFSDKTGTLTENVMKFKLGDVLGTPIDTSHMEDCEALLQDGSPVKDSVSEYFLALALCNTIQPFKDETKDFGVLYEGSSPDEVALVETAAEAGFRLLSRSARAITILFKNGRKKVFTILATLEFTPDRKMMSIIVKDAETGRITLYNKGADSFVTSQLSNAPDVQTNLEKADRVLTDMSSTGLRTLMICAKDVTQSEFESWNATFIEAGKLLRNRSEKVDQVCLQMEKDMRLVGVTAIEDRLQDQVPETLSFFLNAGVVIWMLTGDKRETAVTIAATSTLCNPRTDFVDHIDIGNLDPQDPKAIDKVNSDITAIEQHVALHGTDMEQRCTLVVDGPALNIAMEHFFQRFLEVSQKVNSAVCCRLTPIQKANVVHMFQMSTGLTALAIGDGANDVSMIQEGRVGIGIIGLEGAQAALAADYAIPRFKHLRRLCAVHGRYALVRNASCILVSFYKNLIVTLTQFCFTFYVGFSGQTLYDGWLLTFYNVVLTSIPPFFMGIFDKDLPEAALMSRPKLFTPLASGLYFSTFDLVRWGVESVFHSIMLFFVALPTTVKRDGAHQKLAGMMTGTLIFCGMVFVVLTRFSLQVRYWQWLQLLGVCISVLLFFFIVLVYSSIPSLFGDTVFYAEIFVLMATAKFWFYLLFWVGTVLLIDLSILSIKKSLFPSLRDVAERQYALQMAGKSG